MRLLAGSLSTLRIVRSVFATSEPTLGAGCIPDLRHRARPFSTSPSPRVGVATNHYATLGVDPSADPGAIKGAYYKLAKTYHPDLNQTNGAGDKFLAIQTAYDTLSDDSKRRAYDRDHLPSRSAFTRSNRASTRTSRSFDAFARFDHFGDHRTTYSYEDLKAAATGKYGPYKKSYPSWEDMMYEDDDNIPPQDDPWGDNSSEGFSSFSFSDYYDDMDEFGQKKSSARRQSETTFDEYLLYLAAQSAKRKTSNKPKNGQYPPNPNSQRSRRRGIAAEIRRRERARTDPFSTFGKNRRVQFSDRHNRRDRYDRQERGSQAAVKQALRQERERAAEINKKKRDGPTSFTSLSKSKSKSKNAHDAIVNITRQNAKLGTVLNRVPVSFVGMAGMECALCEGSGIAHEARVKTHKCSRCRGRGTVTLRGFKGKQQIPCQVCNATGFHAHVPRPSQCNACDGTGVAHGKGGRDRLTVRVKIPPNSKDQDILTVPIGKGGASTVRILVRAGGRSK